MEKWGSLKWIKFRLFLVSFPFIIFLGLILFRGYQLQISENVRVNKLAARQYRATVPVHPKRGTIYDRNGNILAIDIQVTSIGLHPHLVSDANVLTDILVKELQVTRDELQKLLKSSRKFVWLKRRISAQIASRIEAYKLKGLTFTSEYRRYYPNKELAGSLLGAVGYDAKALSGLELSLDAYLRTDLGKMVGKKDAKGRLYTPLDDRAVIRNVHLTLDINIQHIAEKYLWQGAEQFKVKSGFVLVGNPNTGEILAVANYPSFNPNRYWKYPQTMWKNHAFIDTFEPGSTFKTILAASALETKTMAPSDTINCEGGFYQIGRHTIKDHHPYGRLSFTDVIRVSSNIGVTKIAEKIGKQPFYQLIRDFGFGERTGLLFPGEENGMLTNYRRWTSIDHANHAFGQGLSVTGVQMLSAYMTIANGGEKKKPHIVAKIKDPENTDVLRRNTLASNRVIREDTAHQLVDMLETVVEEAGTGTKARIDGFRIAGKTGTAQKVDPVTKAYDEEDYVSSFIGLVPADRAQFVIYVVYDTPKPIHVGGLVAAPIFREIAKETLAYSGIVPDQNMQLAQARYKKEPVN